MGYLGSRIMMKGDQEPSLQDLLRDTGRQRGPGTETILMCSPAGEYQANGAVEGTIRRLTGMFRTLKSGYESNIGRKLERDHVRFQWLMQWTAVVINRYQRDSNGRTAYYKQRGRDARKELCLFGEKILYLPLKGSREQDKAETRWKEGL